MFYFMLVDFHQNFTKKCLIVQHEKNYFILFLVQVLIGINYIMCIPENRTHLQETVLTHIKASLNLLFMLQNNYFLLIILFLSINIIIYQRIIAKEITNKQKSINNKLNVELKWVTKGCTSREIFKI